MGVSLVIFKTLSSSSFFVQVLMGTLSLESSTGCSQVPQPTQEVTFMAVGEPDYTGCSVATVAGPWYLCYSVECKGLPRSKTFNPCKNFQPFQILSTLAKNLSRTEFCQSRHRLWPMSPVARKRLMVKDVAGE